MLVRYLYVNNGFPKSNQTVYEIYWSKSQVAARQHSNMALVQRHSIHILKDSKLLALIACFALLVYTYLLLTKAMKLHSFGTYIQRAMWAE